MAVSAQVAAPARRRPHGAARPDRHLRRLAAGHRVAPAHAEHREAEEGRRALQPQPRRVSHRDARERRRRSSPACGPSATGSSATRCTCRRSIRRSRSRRASGKSCVKLRDATAAAWCSRRRSANTCRRAACPTWPPAPGRPEAPSCSNTVAPEGVGVLDQRPARSGHARRVSRSRQRRHPPARRRLQGQGRDRTR